MTYQIIKPYALLSLVTFRTMQFDFKDDLTNAISDLGKENVIVFSWSSAAGRYCQMEIC